MINFLRSKGIFWALSRIIGSKLLSTIDTHDSKQLVREAARRFSVSEEGLTKLLAAKLNLMYQDEPEELNAKINLYNFEISELRDRGFVITKASLHSVTVLCYDPFELGKIRLKTDKRRIELCLASWTTISKLIDKLSACYSNSTQFEANSLNDESLLWRVLELIIKNVEEGSGNSFEIVYDKKETKYSFIDSSMLVRYGSIDSRIAQLLVNFLLKLSSLRKTFSSGTYSLEVSSFPGRNSVLISFIKAECLDIADIIKAPTTLH